MRTFSSCYEENHGLIIEILYVKIKQTLESCILTICHPWMTAQGSPLWPWSVRWVRRRARGRRAGAGGAARPHRPPPPAPRDPRAARRQPSPAGPNLSPHSPQTFKKYYISVNFFLYMHKSSNICYILGLHCIEITIKTTKNHT